MISTNIDFSARTEEIDKYFDFLIILDNPCEINYKDQSDTLITKRIDNNLFIILKANAFILLYNLIEFTVKKSIQEVFNKIEYEQVKYQNLSEKFKKLWINHKGTVLKGLDTLNINKIKDLMQSVAESIILNEVANLEISCINMSGNLDALEIRSIAKQIGFNEVKNGRDLVTIKEKRNLLAHGEFSFGEVGKNYSIKDMLDY